MRAGRRLVEDFLLPALNDRRYGDLLKWEDMEKLHFSIRWSHKNAAKWSLNDTRVFQDWDRMKGHFHPEIKGYYMQAKQRFRAALYKLNTVLKLKSEDKHVKKYQLVEKYQLMLRNGRNVQEKLVTKCSSEIKEEIANVDENQTGIPTSVICWNDAHNRSSDQGFQWSPSFFIQKVPESVQHNYPIANSPSCGGEILDYSHRTLPLLQENCVTSADENFLEAESVTPRTSPANLISVPSGPDKLVPECCNEKKVDRSQFFAQLNLVKCSSVRTISHDEESELLSNKKLCISSEPVSPRSSEGELVMKCSHETSNSDVASNTKHFVAEPPKSPFAEQEDRSSVLSATSSVLWNENGLLPEVNDPIDSVTCTFKSKAKHESLRRKHLADTLRKPMCSPHVPIPPLPGYSKSSVIPRRTESQHNTFLVKDHLAGHKVNPNTLSSSKLWEKTDSIPCLDGPLNLSTKPHYHYKNESPVFTDR